MCETGGQTGGQTDSQVYQFDIGGDDEGSAGVVQRQLYADDERVRAGTKSQQIHVLS